MQMLGTVRIHLTQMVTWMKSHWLVMTLKKKWQFVITGVLAICQTIQSVVAIPLAWTKLNKDQLAAQILSLKALSTKLVTTLARVIVGLIGYKLRQVVLPFLKRVLKVMKRGK
jgi:hypothetical protein